MSEANKKRGRPVTWTETRLDQLRQMAANGMISKLAAHDLGVSHVAVRSVASRYNIAFRGRAGE